MKNTLFYLSTCSTCTRIIKDIQPDNIFTLQDIKFKSITEDQLDELAELSGNYESLFSRRAMKFRALGLQNQDLKEEDYRKLILEEYTFLKRPVFVLNNEIFVGNTKSVIADLKSKLAK